MDVVVLEQEHASGKPLRAEIAPEFGSNLFRLSYGDLELLHYDLELLRRRRWTGTPVLWPLPNRVSGKCYEFGGRSVDLSGVRRPEGNWPLIHGLVDNQGWHHSPPSASGDHLRTWIDISPGAAPFQWFPFPSRLTLEYTLHAGGIRLDYTVDNLGDERLPFAFALHPYFALLDGSHSEICVPAESVMEADDELLPSGRLIPVADAGCDLRSPISAVDRSLDHVFTDLRPGEPCLIRHPLTGVELQLTGSEDFTHVVVYTVKAAAEGFVCVENQTGSADAINLQARASASGDGELERAAHLMTVGPGQRHSGHVEYRVVPL
jgi:aldose 1-epimerase